jgi:hypothetical protein
MSANTETLPGGYPIITAKTTLDQFVSKVMAVPKPQPPDPSSPVAANPAVARCRQAYAQTLKAAMQEGMSQYSASSNAEKAYREAMPPLSGPTNVRDFVACVTYAMLINTISGAEGTRLLYAAQVAHNIRVARPSGRGKLIENNDISEENA